MSDHEHGSEEEGLEEQETDAIKDLDVPDGQAADVGGGAYKITDIIVTDKEKK